MTGHQQLELRTTVFWDAAPIEAKPVSWLRGEVELVPEGESNLGFAWLRISEGERVSACDLPNEFFNHQLLDCEASDDSALVAFVEKWGIPFSPYRFDKHCIYSLPENEKTQGGEARLKRNPAKKAHEKAVSHTDKLLNPYLAFNSVSLDEVRVTVLLLQDFVKMLHEAIRARYADNRLTLGDIATLADRAAKGASMEHAEELTRRLADAARAINAAASNPLQLAAPEFVTLSFPYGLTSAICNQIIETVNDDTPWRECVGCGRLFKKRQCNSKDPRGYSYYCSENCGGAARKRKHDAAQRARKKAAQPKGSEHKEAEKGGVDNG